MDDLLFRVALFMVKGVGPSRYRLLINRFGSPQNVFDASLSELSELVTQRVAKGIKGFDIGKAEGVLRRTEEIGAQIIALDSPEYPERLKPYSYSPPLLWVKGDLSCLNGLTIGIVGTRRPDSYGIRATKKITSALVDSGFTVVSGGAVGIDTVAHRTALEHNGKTVAVLGSGLDVPYPWHNRELFSKISESGALVSEFPPGTKPNAENFPKRNRIISALSDGLVVIEAGRTSGALLTARWALEQGKEIFSLPGPFDSEKSIGTNRLIKEGAKPITEIQDILEEFGLVEEKKHEEISLSGREKEVFDALGYEPIHIDKLTEKTGMEVTEVLGILLGLELKGLVTQIPGKYFVKAV